MALFISCADISHKVTKVSIRKPKLRYSLYILSLRAGMRGTQFGKKRNAALLDAALNAE